MTGQREVAREVCLLKHAVPPAFALTSVYEGLFRFGIRIMPANALSGFAPRKTPVQTRAAVTVGAISEATIQILLKQGANRLTTTRVAERAGVSVGTLYRTTRTKSRCCSPSWRTTRQRRRGGRSRVRTGAPPTAFRDGQSGGRSVCGRQDEAHRRVPSALPIRGGRRRAGAGEARRPAISEGAGGHAADCVRHHVTARHVRRGDDVCRNGGGKRYVLEAGASLR